MVKQKLTSKEEEMIKQELQKYIKPTTLPDILRRAILINKWIPEKYQIYVPKGEFDDKDHFITAEDALKALEDNTATLLDQLAIRRIIQVPKIGNRIDYEFRGLLTHVKNSMVEGINIEPEDDKVRLHHKSENMDVFGTPKIPMKGLNAKPIVHVGKDSKFEEIVNEYNEYNEYNENNENKEDEINDDNANEQPHSGNITIRRRDSEIGDDNQRRDIKADTGAKSAGIDFGDEEDY